MWKRCDTAVRGRRERVGRGVRRWMKIYWLFSLIDSMKDKSVYLIRE